MTEWLVKTFLAKTQPESEAAQRGSLGTFASVVCIVCNALLCLAKGAIGLVAGSVAIVADALNNLADASSNIVSLLGFKLASMPPDAEHPYGHGRFEYLSGLAVAIMIVLIGFELLKTSADKILNPQPVDFSIAIVIVLVLSIVVKLWMARFNKHVGEKINSTTLLATAADSRNDVIATAAVLLSTLAGEFFQVNLDGWAGLAVGAFIIYSGAGLVRDTIDPLLGKAPDPEFVAYIHDKIMSYPHVLGTHDLMVHDYGPGRRFASAHVEMAAEFDPMESHDIIDNIEAAFLSEDGLLLVLHYDPIITSDERVGNMRAWLAESVLEIDSRLTVHDLRLVPGPTHTNVLFDVVKPHGLDMSDGDLKRRLEELVKKACPDAICKITVDDNYASAH